jgi:hypothetical protein
MPFEQRWDFPNVQFFQAEKAFKAGEKAFKAQAKANKSKDANIQDAFFEFSNACNQDPSKLYLSKSL